VGKGEGKRPFGRPRNIWIGNIKMDLRDVKWSVFDWVNLTDNRDERRAVVNTVMNSRIP
jgi:hypothetical protein